MNLTYTTGKVVKCLGAGNPKTINHLLGAKAYLAFFQGKKIMEQRTLLLWQEIASNIILLDKLKYCNTVLDIDKYCLNVVQYCPILSNIAQYCSISFKWLFPHSLLSKF